MLGNTLLVVCLLLNTLLLLFFAVKLLITPVYPTFPQFNVEKDDSYFGLNVLTFGDLFYCLFWGFQALDTYAPPYFFVGRVEKRNSYFSVSIVTSKNISRSRFILCFPLNMLFLPFCCILTWKSIKYIYLVPVYTLNTQRTPYFFVDNR